MNPESNIKDSFLHRTAGLLYERHRSELKDYMLLFPNRRSMLFFRKALVDVAGKPVWAPEMYTLDSWIKQHSDKSAVDELAMIMRLHQCWTTLGGTESFESFYTLGQIILRDFNTLDEALVDRGQFFNDLKNLTGIDLDELQESEPDLAALSKALRKNEIAITLVKIWQQYGALYDLFISELEKLNLTTPGRIYRNMAMQDLTTKVSQLSGTYAIGFYQMLKVEEHLMINISDIQFIWNIPDPEVANKLDWKPPLDSIIRRQNLPSHSFISGQNEKKSIEIYGAAGHQLQLHMISMMLKDYTEDQLAETSIILPEQGLLLPLLQVLPDTIKEINVSMGLSVMDSSVYALMQKFIECLDAWREDIYIKRLPVIQLFDHHLLSNERKAFSQTFLASNSQYWHIDGEFKQLPDRWATLLRPCHQQVDVLNRCLTLLTLIYDQALEELDRAAIYHLVIRLQRLQSALEQQEDDWSPAFFARFLRRILQHSRITLMGEPLRGLQILGIQEMVNLSFKHLIILEANEGVLPSTGHTSCIPHTLAMMYHLPGITEQAAAQEHLFWSSLVSAQKVTLLYNNATQGISKAEKSRWLQRLILKMHPSDWSITTGLIQADRIQQQTVPIELNDSTIIQERIKDWIANSHISPSAINTWLSCRLKFYLEYVLRYRESEDQEDEMDAGRFGSVLHNVMERLLTPYLGQSLTEETFSSIETALSQILDEEYMSHFKIPFRMIQSGSHRIYRDAIQLAILRIVKRDKNITPFTILALEAELKTVVNYRNINLNFYGKADRIDQKEDTIRIVDYKTGKWKPEILKAKYDKIWVRDGKASREALQTLFYSWLYHRMHPEQSVPEIHLYFSNGQKSDSSSVVTIDHIKVNEELLNQFEQDLFKQIDELLSPALTIGQTDNLYSCSYCPYKNMCAR